PKRIEDGGPECAPPSMADVLTCVMFIRFLTPSVSCSVSSIKPFLIEASIQLKPSCLPRTNIVSLFSSCFCTNKYCGPLYLKYVEITVFHLGMRYETLLLSCSA